MDTISDFQKRLSNARRIVLIGNGGIANELAYELKNVEIIWAIRHQTIAASYLDKQAATLFLPRLQQGRLSNTIKSDIKVDKYTIENNNQQMNPWTHGGCALGPHWLAKLHQNEIKSINQVGF
uniref:FAD/NAD(P)-binding domain-containing protein n=1 Tax=Panagrolaimus sp. JU765 TaxID=591449 RepID=A0AC34QXV0_9BILA